jgi:hypothetical protein
MALSVQRADTPNSLPGTDGERAERGSARGERTARDERVVVRADVARAKLAHLSARAVVAWDDRIAAGAREGAPRRERVGDGGGEREEEGSEERVHGSLNRFVGVGYAVEGSESAPRNGDGAIDVI